MDARKLDEQNHVSGSHPSGTLGKERIMSNKTTEIDQRTIIIIHQRIHDQVDVDNDG